MTKPKEIYRAIVALNIPERMGDRITLAGSILKQMTGNPHFAAPPFTTLLPLTRQNLAILNQSHARAKGGGAGLVARRDTDWAAVKANLNTLKLYVQDIADNTPDKSHEIILGAGMFVKKIGVRIKPDLQAIQGNTSGTVILVGRGAGSRSNHDWQMSTDRIHWEQLPTTLGAKTTVTGLTYGTTVYFQHRATVLAGKLPWTDPVSILVH